MTDGEGPQQQTEFEQASTRLDQGLKNCRTVLESYRVMLTGQNDAVAAQPPSALNDNPKISD